MDFSAKLENLQAKVDNVVASVRAAAAEDRDQLKQRVDQAQDDANKAVADAKQRTDEAADRAQSKWAQMKADAAARREDIKAKSTSGPISWTPRLQPTTQTGPRRTQPTPSTTPSWLSPTHNWQCSTRSTRAPTQTNGPRSPAARPSLARLTANRRTVVRRPAARWNSLVLARDADHGRDVGAPRGPGLQQHCWWFAA
jgi:hypothetical protein